ncbi:MAG: pilus assembly protein N-terminal domain-containing protein [Planctomycetes bacterium]|nr:pilus assembly protein N-terminal domain-containing protein [Planctomycetota bacterium]
MRCFQASSIRKAMTVLAVWMAIAPTLAMAEQPGARPTLRLAWQQPPVQTPPPAAPSMTGPQPVMHKVQAASERVTMIANSSRILTLEQRIPEATVNNPELVDVIPLSPNQLQIYAKKPGVTQINLWTENKAEVFTVELLIYADARELTALLQAQFPKSALQVIPLPNSVIIGGYVDDPTQVNRIISIAEQFHPTVINNIQVGGAQQVVLKVRVMEVSRTKLRQLGIDFAEITSSGSYVGSAGAGLLKPNALLSQTVQSTSSATGVSVLPGQINTAGTQSFAFGIVDNYQSFSMFMQALRQDNLAKVLSEPDIVTVSGRPAYFNAGGEFPILVPNSLGTVAVQYRPYGTQVDFVPIVLGNGAIRLEVRPRVSEIDNTTGTTLNGITVPGLKVREIDTGVEMRAGQTLAIAGLVNYREEAAKSGLPILSELPFIGPFFGTNKSIFNEVELLIMVTPHWVEAMDCDQVPNCGPGMDTTFPTDFQMYVKGHVEVPKLVAPNVAPGDMPMNYPNDVPPGEVVPANSPTPPVPAPDATGKSKVSGLIRPAALIAPGSRSTTPSNSGQGTTPPNVTLPATGTSAAGSAALVRTAPVVTAVPTIPNAPAGAASPVRLPQTSVPTPQNVSAPVRGPALSSPIALPTPRNNPNDRSVSHPATQAIRQGAKPAPGFIGPLGYDDLK